MKAKIKKTGEIIDVKEYASVKEGVGFLGYIDEGGKTYPKEELTVIGESKSIDWEQRRYEIAKSCLNALLANNDYQECVNESIEYADKLIKKLKKN